MNDSNTTNTATIAGLLERQRAYFSSGITLPLEFRRDALRRLRAAIVSAEAAILAALHSDLRKPACEAYTSEIAMVITEVDHAIKHLKAWARSKRKSVPWIVWPATARLAPRPLGVALIIGPWNYPLQLLILPLVGAIAAGNCAVLKPSEFAPATSAVIAGIIEKTFPAEHIVCVQGDRQVADALLQEQFDKIFFTGSTAVGRSVAAIAGARLTPVTLELGGKCPVIVCGDANLRVAARRIIWAKTLNAGQSCVAPDYLLVDRSAHAGLLRELTAAIGEMFGSDAQQSADFGRIINRRHFDRLAAYLGDGTVAFGGQTDPADLFIAPTILENVGAEAAVMNEEIFGPILPVVPFDDLPQALAMIRSRPAPLAVYLFSASSENRSRIENQIRCGGICVNDVMVHLLGKALPFGGVGDSGIGAYHGKASFDCFSHEQTVLRCSTALDPSLRYPRKRSHFRTSNGSCDACCAVERWLSRGGMMRSAEITAPSNVSDFLILPKFAKAVR